MTTRPRPSSLTGVAAALVALATAPAARGQAPAAGQIAVDPSAPSHVVVRTTYGVLSTTDGGASWGWICDEAVGYGGVEAPMMAMTSSGSVLAGVFEGLAVSSDTGCSWSFQGGDLTHRPVMDVAVEKADPSHAVLLVADSIGGGSFLSQVWESTDNGHSWTQAGVDLPTSYLPLDIEVAPSDPQRIYVTGRIGPSMGPGLARSSDRGQTWEVLAMPAADETEVAYLGAIHPTDSDLLYVRRVADPSGSVLVSPDGGETWSSVFEGKGRLDGFALSADGATAYVGAATTACGGRLRPPTSSRRSIRWRSTA